MLTVEMNTHRFSHLVEFHCYKIDDAFQALLYQMQKIGKFLYINCDKRRKQQLYVRILFGDATFVNQFATFILNTFHTSLMVFLLLLKNIPFYYYYQLIKCISIRKHRTRCESHFALLPVFSSY